MNRSIVGCVPAVAPEQNPLNNITAYVGTLFPPSCILLDIGKPGPAPTVTLEDVLSVFDERADQSEPLTAPEIADTLGSSRRTILEKLHTLEDQGELKGKKVGGRAVVWWRVDSDSSEEAAPAAPLRQIVGMLNDDAANRAEERSQEWRDEFNQQMGGL